MNKRDKLMCAILNNVAYLQRLHKQNQDKLLIALNEVDSIRAKNEDLENKNTKLNQITDKID